MVSTGSILAFSTKGSGTNEERRLRKLLSNHNACFLKYDKCQKWNSFVGILKSVASQRPDLLVMEGTGLGGGVACLLAHFLLRQRYVVSSGDAVGPFVAGIVPLLGFPFAVYERLLCRFCSGFIGWTPYLAGRALTFGAPRAMTAAGWSEQVRPAPDARHEIRAALGIPQGAIVFGLLGAIVWNARYKYCYGMELVRAASTLDNADICVLVIGDGTGLEKLREAAGDRLGKTVFLPGSVTSDKVIDSLSAFDVGSLPQSVDGVGSFRYTTKISEYIAAGLPIVTGQVPLSYDLDNGWIWRLPGDAPWTDDYAHALRTFMCGLNLDELALARNKVPIEPSIFNSARQVRASTGFIADILSVQSSRDT